LDAETPALRRAVEIAGDAPDRIVAVVGPTASGKTDLAVALAEHIGAEIVSVDSVQIYRGFDIGSGKPTALELRRAPHHLIGAIEPLDPMDAARFAELGRSEIRHIQARGKRVVVCGGTFLWIKALLFGLAEAPPASPEVRERHRALAREKGRAALHDALRGVDPESAARLHPNDVVRVSRALEVYELTGTPLGARERAFKPAQYDARLVALRHGTHELTLRIERRVDAMLAAGFVDEVRGLVARGYGEARALGSVGYREVRAFLAGELPGEGDLARAIVRATRVFARRQRTWLNHEPVEWLPPRNESR
jgi:tRNA dimethylallyltransferase